MFNKYPYTDFHELNLDWFLKQFKELVADWDTFKTDLTDQWEQVSTDWQTLYTYVHDYFDNLDAQAEIDHKLDEMAQSGQLATIAQPAISSATSAWLAEHVTQPTTPAIDTSLTISGAAADARVTGDRIRYAESDIDTILSDLNLYIAPEATGLTPANSQANVILTPLELVNGHSYTYRITYAAASDAVSYLYLIDENVNVISSITIPAGNTTAERLFTATSDVSNCSLAINTAGRVLDYTVTFIDNSAPQTTYIEDLQTYVYDLYTDINDKYHAHISNKNIGATKNLEMTSSALITPAADQPKRITIYFPCVQGQRYTVDKKYRTQYFRLGYTTGIPDNGSAIQGYQVLTSNTNYLTFTAAYTGYACMKIYQEDVDTNVNYNDILAACVAYPGYYDSTVTQTAEKVTNFDGLVFYCGPERALNTLKAGIEEAEKYMDSILYVDAGTYDLVQEFGTSWFDSLSVNDTLAGLVLKNRIHIIFSPDSKVVSHYTGANQYALSLYSPFNAGEYGFIIENLNLDCSRCRYAIHDERNGAPEEYIAKMINCKMKIDNSNNASWNARHCIGGGLGANACIQIEGCIFESDEASNRGAVYYHIPNIAITDYRDMVIIKDCYFITGCITLADVAGTPASLSDNSEYVITNNSYSIRYTETNDQGIYNELTRSYNLRAWSNTFRA